MEKNQNVFHKALFILLLASFLVATFPLLQARLPFLEKQMKDYSLVPDFVQFETPITDSLVDSTLELVVIDSLNLVDPLVDSSALKKDSLAKQAALIDPEVIPIDGTYLGVESLDSFFKALHQRKEQVRIAYYGDSSIEGDLICMTLRDSMQKRFGGHGVGFVPLMSKNPGFRRSVYQSASNNWSRNVVGTKNSRRISRGISGEYFTAISASPVLWDSLAQDSLPPLDNKYWSSYKGSRHFSRTRRFDKVRLFYGTPPRDTSGTQKRYGSLSVSINNKRKPYTLRPQKLINELDVSDSTTQRARLYFQVPPNFPLYGVSLESENGVLVDNFPLRGSDGGALRSISKRTLQEFQEYLNYDLIVFQFGLNVMNPKIKGYSWYQKRIEALIRHYQEALPGVPILVIGVPDRGVKIEGKMQTDPSVPRITKVQRAAAQRCGVAFFSLYEAMGGEGTMVDWVETKVPKLANADYTHFNFRGARIVSYMLIDYLNTHYMDYVIERHEF